MGLTDYPRVLKYGSLVLLVGQNCTAVLLMRYVKTCPVEGRRFSINSAVFVQEFVKCVIASGAVLLSAGSTRLAVLEVSQDFFKAAIPATLFAIQNTLLFVALGNLEATLFQVTYQLKLLCTAILMVIMLGHQINLRKWSALILLFIAIVATQIYAAPTQASGHDTHATVSSGSPRPPKTIAAKDNFKHDGNHVVSAIHKKIAANDVNSINSGLREGAKARTVDVAGVTVAPISDIDDASRNQLVGLLAVMVCASSSGFASVYTEKILKQSSVGLWPRNVQLSLLSGAIAGSYLFTTQSPWEILTGFDAAVWLLVFVQAAGGFIVSVVVKYADNLLKGFATSIAIIVSGLVSFTFLDFAPTSGFLIGAAMVVFATIMYSISDDLLIAPKQDRREFAS